MLDGEDESSFRDLRAYFRASGLRVYRDSGVSKVLGFTARCVEVCVGVPK